MEEHRISRDLKLFKNPHGMWVAQMPNANGGEPRRSSLRTSDLTEALNRVDKLGLVEEAARARSTRTERQIKKQLGLEADLVKISDAADEWELHLPNRPLRLTTIKRMIVTVRTLSRHKLFEGKSVSEVTAKDLDKYVNGTGNKISSIRSMMGALESFFDWCVETGKCQTNPIKGVTIRVDKMTQDQLLPKDYDPVTLSDLNKILEVVEVGSFDWCALLLSWHTGLRMGDIAQLQWASIGEQKITIVTSKRGAIVQHDITKEVREVMKHFPERSAKVKSTKERYAATFTDGDRRTPDKYVWPVWALKYRTNHSTLAKRFSRLFEKAGVDSKSFHGIRRAWMIRTQSAEAEKALKKLEALKDELANIMGTSETAKLAGHRNIKTTTHYLRPAKKK